MQNQNCDCSRLSREELFNKINEVSFAADDILLFLDTHPGCAEAMECFDSCMTMRRQYLKEYARHYGPLTLDSMDTCEDGKWQWALTPMPWENKGGCC